MATKEEKNNFSIAIERMTANKKISYIEAITLHCEETGLEVELAATLINDILKSFQLNPSQIPESESLKLNGFIMFYINISGNIALNIYMELNKLLASMKQISLLLKIIKIFMREILLSKIIPFPQEFFCNYKKRILIKNKKLFGEYFIAIDSGSVEAKLPTGVDSQGNIVYTNKKFAVQNPINSYVRMVYTGEINRQMSYVLGGTVIDNGHYRAQAILRLNF